MLVQEFHIICLDVESLYRKSSTTNFVNIRIKVLPCRAWRPKKSHGHGADHHVTSDKIIQQYLVSALQSCFIIKSPQETK